MRVAAAHALMCTLRHLRRQPVGALIHAVAGMRPDVPETNCRAIGS